MCINRGGCNVRSGDEYRLAPTHVTLDIPFQLVLVLFVSRLLEASGLGVGLVGGSASSPVEVPGRRPRHCTAQYGTTRHETPCDRRHTDALTKVLTTRLGETFGLSSNPQVSGYTKGGERRDLNPLHPEQ